LLVHRAYENVTIPTLKKEFAAAQVLDADLARKANEARTPEAREALREIQVQHAKQVLEGVKSTTAAADAAKSALRKEFNAKGGTRRRLRGGQDKFSPLAKKLMVHRHYQNTVQPLLADDTIEALAVNREKLDRMYAETNPELQRRLAADATRHGQRVALSIRSVSRQTRQAKEALVDELDSAGGRRRKTRRKW
jgi:hypothetical protein